jgi:hypothetical protein
MYQMYQAETYNLTDVKKEKLTFKTDDIETFIEKIENEDNYYHMHLVDGERYIFYLDLDGYEHDMERFKEDFTLFAKQRYGWTIEDDDFSYTTNTGKVGSHHITLPRFNAKTSKQKEIIQQFQKHADKITSKGVDDSVYNKKPFRLPNQTKGRVSRKVDGVWSEVKTIRTPHKITVGSTEDFVLNHIPRDSTNIDAIEYIPTEEEKKAMERAEKKEKTIKKKELERKVEESRVKGDDAETEQI